MHTGTAKQKQAGADVTYSVLVDPDVTHTVRGRGKDFVSERGEYTSEVGTCNDTKVPAMGADIRQTRGVNLVIPIKAHERARTHTFFFAWERSCLGASCESNHAHVLCNESGGDFTIYIHA